MDILFDGFQNTLPVTWIVILITVVVALSFWSYRREIRLSARTRWLLAGLRSAALILLLILLLNPVFILQEEFTSPVQIALLLDNSQSATIEKGDYHGMDHYEEIINKLTPDPSGRFEHLSVEYFGFDEELFTIESADELNFSGTRTNIDHALEDLLSNHLDREEALILVTDGIITSGRDPSGTASRMPVPIFTVGIGDTSRLNDVIVQRVTHNPSASLNSRINVEASVLNDGFPNRDLPVQLIQNGNILEEQTVRSSELRSVQNIHFELTLDEEGLQQFQIHIPEVEGEWSTENNSRYFSVDVRDDRIRILHLAFDVHPDVRIIRSFLREDEHISLENRTWVHEDRFIEGALPDRPDTLDLVILHGFPHVSLSSAFAGEIANRFRDNALLIMGSPGQEINRLSSLFPGQLPLQFESGYTWYDVQAQTVTSQNNHPIFAFDIPEDLRPASIRGGVRNVTESGNTAVLLRSAYRGTPTDAPLLAVRTTEDHRIAHLNGYNFYRWSLSHTDEHRHFWENLLNNTVKWTASSPDEELLVLSPSNPIFQIGEPFIINGFLRNEAGDPEETAVINILVENDDVDDRRYVMSNEGSGRYQLEIDNLPEGTYEYEGVARRGDREIDTRSGQFIIGGVNRELLNTIRNDELLQLMAQSSNGTYLAHDRVDELYDRIEELLGFDERTEITARSLALHRHPFWFVLVILLLTTEWVIRKYRALP
ncbi:MAG: hypothetical protein WD097_04625 [Balneolales bacterium]